MGGLVQNLGAGSKFKCSPEKARNPGQRFLLQAAENNNNNTTHTHTPCIFLSLSFRNSPWEHRCGVLRVVGALLILIISPRIALPFNHPIGSPASKWGLKSKLTASFGALARLL